MDLHIHPVRITPPPTQSAEPKTIRSLCELREQARSQQAVAESQRHAAAQEEFVRGSTELTLDFAKQLADVSPNRATEPGMVVVTGFPLQIKEVKADTPQSAADAPQSAADAPQSEADAKTRTVSVDAEMRFDPKSGEVTFLHIERDGRSMHEFLRAHGRQYHFHSDCFQRVPAAIVDESSGRIDPTSEFQFNNIGYMTSLGNMQFFRNHAGQSSKVFHVSEIIDALGHDKVTVALPQGHKLRLKFRWKNEIGVGSVQQAVDVMRAYDKKYRTYARNC